MNFDDILSNDLVLFA